MQGKSAGIDGLQYLEMDALEMSFPDNRFDVVVDKATLVLIHCILTTA